MPDHSITAIWQRLTAAQTNGADPNMVNSLYGDLGCALCSELATVHLGEYVVIYAQPGSGIPGYLGYVGADGYDKNEPVYFKTLDAARLAIARSERITRGDEYSIRQIQFVADLFQQGEVEFHAPHADPIMPIREEDENAA